MFCLYILLGRFEDFVFDGVSVDWSRVGVLGSRVYLVYEWDER